MALTRSLSAAGSDRALYERRVQITELQEQLSTGLRVRRPSDDPSAFAGARRLEGLHDRYEQYLRTINTANAWVDHMQDVLDQGAELLTEVYEKGIRASSASYNVDERDAEADRMEAMIDELVTLLNERHNGEYLFAGSRTTVEPFTNTGAGVAYNGNSNGRTRQIGDGVTIDINIPGDQIQDTGAGFTVFEAIQDLADAVRAGDPVQLEAALQEVITARDHLVDRAAEAGGVANLLESAADQLRLATVRIEGQRSELEDADLAEVITDFQRAQTSLQAALKATASVLQTSLVDYLR